MKKLISIVLCLTMLMSCFALFASANTEDFTVTAVTPEIDGVVNVGEYAVSKVYAADASLQWQWTGSKGVTLTEYGAQDADYVYFALEFDKAISSTEIYFDATDGVRYDWDGMQDYDWFTFSDINADGVAGTYSVWAGGNIDQTSIAKTTDGKTVIEIKMSKESVKTAFGLDSFDAFAYFVNAAALVDGGSIGNYTWLDNAEMDEHFSGREWGIWYAYYGVDGESEWYPNACILGNIVVLTGEELPETPAYYCGATDECTAEGHADRAEVLDLADLRDFGLLPALFVPAAEASEPEVTEPEVTEPEVTEPEVTEPEVTEPEVTLPQRPDDVPAVVPTVDGVIDEWEYTSGKLYSGLFQFQWTGDRGATLIEYVSHDADFVYFALVYDVELSTIEIMMNGSAEVRDDWDSAARYGWFTFNNIDAAGVDATFNAYNFGNLDYIACAKVEDGKTVAELMISKESMLTAYELDTLDYFGYYARAWMTDGKEINNGTWIDNQAFADNGWGYGNESGFAEGYTLGDWYTTQGWTLMNIVILSDETLPENPTIYCPAGDDCTNPNHANRAEIFDLADLRCFGLLPGHFVAELVLPEEPEVTEPDVTEPDVTEPDVTEPDVTEPDVTEPDVTEPDVTEPDVTEPDVTEPDVTEPDVTEPDVTEPDATEPNATQPDATQPDATQPSATEPQASGCNKSIALSALAIVPVLGLGVAVVAKKKED